MDSPYRSIGFAKLADASLITKADAIIDALTGNAHSTTPKPTLAAVQTAATVFQEALAAAEGGEKLKTAEKNAARATLLTLLRSLALYVQQNCQDDLAILLSSGFDARKAPAPAGALLVRGVLSGVLDFRSKPVVNAKACEAQTTTEVNKPETWEDAGTFSSTRIALADLTPGTIYWARVRAIGAAGPGGVERDRVGDGDVAARRRRWKKSRATGRQGLSFFNPWRPLRDGKGGAARGGGGPSFREFPEKTRV